MSDLNKMSGTPWHIEKMHKKDGDGRRHRSRCIYYEHTDQSCNRRMFKCKGSAHCEFYKENNNPSSQSIVFIKSKHIGKCKK